MKKLFGKIKGAFTKFGNNTKRCFKSTSSKTKKTFGPLNTLVAMQFKDKMSFSFKADKKGAIIKLVLYLVLIIGLSAILAFLFSLLAKLSVFGLNTFPIYFFNFFFILMFLISIVTCLVGFTNSLYFSPDNQVLLTYPVKANTVFLSKIVVYYLFELIKNFGYLFPLFLAYGIANKFVVGFYFWMPFCLIFVSMVPVAIAAFLSIIVMWIKMWLRKAPLIQNILFPLVLLGAAAAIFYFISLIPAELRIAQDWQTIYLPGLRNGALTMEKIFLPIEYLSKMIMGYVDSKQPAGQITNVFTNYTAPVFFIMLGSIILLFIFAMLIVRPLFFKTASKPFEYKKIAIKHYFVTEKTNIQNYVFAMKNHPKDESKREKKNRQKKFEKILRVLKSEEGHLIKNNHVYSKKILNLINKYSKDFEFIQIEKGEENLPENSFAIISLNNVYHLVLVIRSGHKKCYCYDPNYLAKKNKVKEATFSAFSKDTKVDVRTSAAIFNNLVVLLLPGLLVYLLNKILCALRLNANGITMTVTFSLMVVLLILLASNISAASIFSKEGQSSYLLKAAPVNYMKALSTKLIGKLVIGVGSVIVTCVCFYFGTTISMVNFVLFGFILFFLFVGHLLWSAELDYMHPQENLFSTSGETRSVTSSSETLSGIFGLLTIVIFCVIAFFLIQQSSSTAFIRLFIIALLYFIARVVLFATKVKAYKTSRSENR